MRKAKKNSHPKVKQVKGAFLARGLKFGIVVSEFNEFLTRQLLEGALDTLVRHGALEKDVTVVYVPGAFEIPLALKKLAAKKKLDAIITLAVVIKGQTKHFDQVSAEASRGVADFSQKSEIPVILGIISADSAAVAAERVGIKHLNKGREWALSAIEMASLMKKL
jgi:6,7-dimethyl-8-ribityllumazine synthase